MPGCIQYVVPLDTRFVLASAQGTASLRQTVPDDRAFLGVPFYFQWWLLDPDANRLGVTTTAGGRATVGR